MNAISSFDGCFPSAIYNTYADSINVLKTVIPTSVRAAETTIQGTSIYQYDGKGKVAKAYQDVTEEVITHGSKGED